MTPGIAFFGGVVFTVVGVVILVIGWRDFRARRAFLRRSVRTSGVIVATHVERGSLDDGGDFEHPMIRFSTSSGEEVTFTSLFGRRQPWKDGQSVRIRYRPDQPHVAELDSFLSIWLTSCVCGVLGLVSLGAGIMVIVLTRANTQ